MYLILQFPFRMSDFDVTYGNQSKNLSNKTGKTTNYAYNPFICLQPFSVELVNNWLTKTITSLLDNGGVYDYR